MTDWPPPPQIERTTPFSGETPPGDIDQLLTTMAEQFPDLRWTAGACGGYRQTGEDGGEFFVPLRWYVAAIDEAGWRVSTYLPSLEIAEFWPQLLAGNIRRHPRPETDSVATERLSRILDLETALLRAQTCHSRHDPNQHLFAEIAEAVAALVDDARLRARHDVVTS